MLLYCLLFSLIFMFARALACGCFICVRSHECFRVCVSACVGTRSRVCKCVCGGGRGGGESLLECFDVKIVRHNTSNGDIRARFPLSAVQPEVYAYIKASTQI